MPGILRWLGAQPTVARAALAGALVLGVFGCNQPTLQPATEVASTTLTDPQAAGTGSTVPSGLSLHGTVFHDWNGNGKQDSDSAPGEPALPGIRVCLDDADSGLCGVTSADGKFAIEEAPLGEHSLWIDSDRYSYLFISVNEVAALETQDVCVRIDGPSTLNLGLGEGPLTLPFPCAEMGQVAGVSDHFDADIRPGQARDWMGRSQAKDGYAATTFAIRGKATVVASAPGLVFYVGGYADLYLVEVHCFLSVPWFPGNQPLSLWYVGLDEVAVQRGDIVARGQVLGRVLESGSATAEGLERLTLRAFRTDGFWGYVFHDLYRDIQKVGARGFWTRDNDPACF
jgi:murein DD-endopeptidase MepM/ murein hydrolase activator NlpD